MLRIGRNRGTIVPVGSALAYRAIPSQAAYCGAKFAIRFTDALRSELIHDASRVHVTMVQMPALNTPLDWCRTRMPRERQPVPPAFQPEVAAQAILWTAHHHRRELWVGASTGRAIVLNKLLPAAIDRYLARYGYMSQQAGMLVAQDRRDNLWQPVTGDPGAHGGFGAQARTFSPVLWLATHRVAVPLAIAAIAVFAVPPRRRVR